MAATWAGLIRDGKNTAADEVEKTGKMAYGDEAFKKAMADAVGGQGGIGQSS